VCVWPVSGESANFILRKRVRKRVGVGERQSPDPARLIFHVPFVFFVPSLLSESLERASVCGLSCTMVNVKSVIHELKLQKLGVGLFAA